MKRRKETHNPRSVPAAARVPAHIQYPGLIALLKKAGLVDDRGQPTAEGRKALS